MQVYVEGLSQYVIDRYKLYIETLIVDFVSVGETIEFRVGYALRRDHRLRSLTLKVQACDAVSDDERRAVIDALFLEVEDQIDESIALNRVGLH